MSSVRRPILSIVIPTRNRIETLRHTIDTVLQQSVVDGFEVVISDNGDQSNTDVSSLVDAFKDDRLVFVKTPCSLSMCDSWEFALNKASGEIICFIGDDDGFMPYGVESILHADIKYSPDLFFWREHCYAWPGALNESALLIDKTKPTESAIFDPIVSLEKVLCWGGSGLRNVPMIYHSAVRRSVIEKVQKKVGRYFASRQPDVFPAFASIFESSKCVNIGRALTVSGWSVNSNSGSMRQSYSSSANESYIQAFSSWKLHSALVENKKLDFFYATPESILMALDYYPNRTRAKFNFSSMWALYVRLSGYRNYFWLVVRWSHLTSKQSASLIIFHGYLAVNLCKTTIDILMSIIGVKPRKIPADNVLEFVNNVDRFK